MIQPPRGLDLPPGSLVEVRNKDNSFAGYAFFHPENTIALRIVSENKHDDIDTEFLGARLRAAADLRLLQGIARRTDSWRVVHAEADLLPGLVVDKFGPVLLVEPYIAGWMHLMDPLADALRKVFPGCTIAVRADAHAAQKEGVSFAALERRFAPPESVDITENGIKYHVDFRAGHKTGFFLDQRENRKFVSSLSQGRTVLDLCCYTGGFALSAHKGGAASVDAVDLDEEALATAAVNARLNGAERAVRFIHRDAFDEMRERQATGRRPDLLVLDPPKLAAGPDDVERALRQYFDLNVAALRLVRPGGLFVTCSCSGAVSEERWRQTVRRAAADAGVGLTMFHAAGPGGDHPVAGDFPQGRYLKVLFARVD